MNMTIYEQVFEILRNQNIKFEHFSHSASESCIDSANNRNLDLSVGAKSLLFKGKDGFCIFTIRAHLEVDSNKVRKILASNKLRFASQDELLKECRVVKGALPPLVSLVYGLPHFIDKSLQTGEKIAFNAGVLTESVVISTEDFFKLVSAKICEFSK